MPGAIEQILLLVFVLVTLVGIAGGKPADVLAPLTQLTIRLVAGLAGLLFAALTAIIKALITLTPTLLRAVAGGIQTASSRRTR